MDHNAPETTNEFPCGDMTPRSLICQVLSDVRYERQPDELLQPVFRSAFDCLAICAQETASAAQKDGEFMWDLEIALDLLQDSAWDPEELEQSATDFTRLYHLILELGAVNLNAASLKLKTPKLRAATWQRMKIFFEYDIDTNVLAVLNRCYALVQSIEERNAVEAKSIVESIFTLVSESLPASRDEHLDLDKDPGPPIDFSLDRQRPDRCAAILDPLAKKKPLLTIVE